MQSSPGSLDPRVQPAVSLAILALVALGVSLMLAIASLPRPRIETPVVQHSVVATAGRGPVAVPPARARIAEPVPAPPKVRGGGEALGPLLIPWAIAVDALALVGLAVIVVVRLRAQT